MSRQQPYLHLDTRLRDYVLVIALDALRSMHSSITWLTPDRTLAIGVVLESLSSYDVYIYSPCGVVPCNAPTRGAVGCGREHNEDDPSWIGELYSGKLGISGVYLFMGIGDVGTYGRCDIYRCPPDVTPWLFIRCLSACLRGTESVRCLYNPTTVHAHHIPPGPEHSKLVAG